MKIDRPKREYQLRRSFSDLFMMCSKVASAESLTVKHDAPIMDILLTREDRLARPYSRVAKPDL
jgi:hypothetical protein